MRHYSAIEEVEFVLSLTELREETEHQNQLYNITAAKIPISAASSPTGAKGTGRCSTIRSKVRLRRGQKHDVAVLLNTTAEAPLCVAFGAA